MQPSSTVLPFQRLDVYIAAKEFVRLVHDARIRDRELCDQASRAAKSMFLQLAEGLPQRGIPMRADAGHGLRSRIFWRCGRARNR